MAKKYHQKRGRCSTDGVGLTTHIYTHTQTNTNTNTYYKHGDTTISIIVLCALLGLTTLFFAHDEAWTAFHDEGDVEAISKSGNSLHGPLDLAAIPPTDTHIVDATICTYESSKTLPSKGFVCFGGRRKHNAHGSIQQQNRDTCLDQASKRQ